MPDKQLSYRHGVKKTHTETIVADGNTDIELHAPSVDFQLIGSGSPGTIAILASGDDSDYDSILAATSTDQTVVYNDNAPYFRLTVASYSSGSWTVNMSWYDGDGG